MMKRGTFLLLPLLAGLSGCAVTLEWRQVGGYGPKPSTDQIFDLCVNILREKGWRLTKVDRGKRRIETNWRTFAAMAGGKRAQLRIQLLRRRPLTYVFVMGVKNENLDDRGGPLSTAYGPDENDRMLEIQYQMLIDRKIRREYSKKSSPGGYR